MLETTKKIIYKKVTDEDTFIDCKITYDTKKIYSITIYNYDDCVDFVKDYLTALNKYPIYMNIALDEYMEEDLISLLTKDKISFEKIVDTYTSVHFQIIIKNDVEFHMLYEYFSIAATNALTNIYSFKKDLIKKKISENDHPLEYDARLTEGDILIGLGNDSSILEIWTTDRKVYDTF